MLSAILRQYRTGRQACMSISCLWEANRDIHMMDRQVCYMVSIMINRPHSLAKYELI